MSVSRCFVAIELSVDDCTTNAHQHLVDRLKGELLVWVGVSRRLPSLQVFVRAVRLGLLRSRLLLDVEGLTVGQSELMTVERPGLLEETRVTSPDFHA